MSDSSRDLLVRGVAAAKAGDKKEARFYLEWVLRSDADQDQLIQAWRWLAELSDDPAEKRGYLEDILAHNMYDPEARRELAILDGNLDPDDLVDASNLETSQDDTPQAAGSRRFVCKGCGGRMIYSPDGSALTCEYCGSHEALQLPNGQDGLEEQDFILTLATAKGHTRPVAQQAARCGGCGASFVLPPSTLSLTCPYCGTNQAITATESGEWIAPEGIIPFFLTPQQAHARLHEWLQEQNLPAGGLRGTPSGVYLPVWDFNVGGQMGWLATDRARDGTTRSTSGSQPFFHMDLLVPASGRLPRDLAPIVDTFNLEQIVSYDARFLASWPAETYEISVSDASLTARQLARARSAPDLDNEGPPMGWQRTSFTVISTNMAVDSFQLILVPVWLATYVEGGKAFTIAVNGQTGAAMGQKPARGFTRWLNRLLGEP